MSRQPASKCLREFDDFPAVARIPDHLRSIGVVHSRELLPV
jgi:hypothetical protein